MDSDQMRSLNQIRQTFLDFFAKNGHQIVPSAPLVPFDDPTLLFVNAGMVPFKNRFTGLEKGDYVRAVSSQKCVRAGGKHNDLDNVGYTARHHTFFEMLGNFSFGDYFKEDAIALAWELITKEYSLPKDRLLVTVYHDDDEAVKIWKKVAGFGDDKIIRIATSDNFWSMGDTGPCGPCSEIFFDHGDKIAGGPPGSKDEDGDRFIEIWNLVFMQYEQYADGTRVSLPAPSIDTGMGLERMTALLQGKHDNYETDVMRSLIEASAHYSNSDADGEFQFSHRILADHLRSSGFLIADGVSPSNEGRGYVLRRIMRRAMRHAHIIGTKEPLMHQLVPSLIAVMGEAYPELERAKSLLTETFLLEEEAFRKTLARGLDLLETATSDFNAGDILAGETAFKLYDTYGFPLDLTQDILRSKNITIDQEGFDKAMQEQKDKARASWSGSGDTASEAIWFTLKNTLPATAFTGYIQEEHRAKIIALVKDGIHKDSASIGDKVDILLDISPFYAESGGQCGDTGTLRAENSAIDILGTQKKAGVFHVLQGVVTQGTVTIGQDVTAGIDKDLRQKIRANHSATHLLHEALRRVVGDMVTQKGSQVASTGLRFDFSSSKPMTSEQIAEVEKMVNQIIRQNAPVTTEILTPDEAVKRGALALFGEKYGDEVRVLFMGEPKDGKVFSIELCGGTHVTRLGDIGLFVITSESGVSSGVRRIEALTGEEALHYMNERRHFLTDLSDLFKTAPQDIYPRVTSLLEDKKRLEREISDLKKKLALSGGDNAGQPQSQIQEIAGIKFVGKILDGLSPKELAGVMDAQKQAIGSGVIVLVAIHDDKAGVAVGVTPDLTGRFNAVDMVRTASGILGGKGGGGRPDFAQAGGSDTAKANDAIEAVKEILGIVC